jgi:hypothetical protein
LCRRRGRLRRGAPALAVGVADPDATEPDAVARPHRGALRRDLRHQDGGAESDRGADDVAAHSHSDERADDVEADPDRDELTAGAGRDDFRDSES